MSDDFRRRRPSDMGTRVTVLERQVDQTTRLLDRVAEKVEKLDSRLDQHDVMFARLIGALIVIQALVILFAPTIRAVLGVAPQ
jgi:CII-binding regulator of phage lambda lysogenization HflD